MSEILSNLGPKTAGMKRRYRSGNRKRPTTLLTANPANFRDLVQQFTGCNKTSSISSCRASKGPITINFALGIMKQQQQQQNFVCPDTRDYASKVKAMPHQQTRRAEEENDLPQQHEMREQEEEDAFWDLSFLDNTNDHVNGDLDDVTSCFPESSNVVAAADHISQGMVMDDLYFLA